MDQTKLIVCQKKSDISHDTPAIVLSEVISKFDENEANKTYASLIHTDVEQSYDVPVYSIIAKQMWDGIGVTRSSPRSMEVLVQLYRYLKEQVTEETEQIQCTGVSGVYLDFLRDFADNENLELNVINAVIQPPPSGSRIVRSVAWLLLSLFDAFLSLLLRPFFPPTDADVLVKYPIFRPDTFRPIETRMDMEFDSTFTLLTLSYFTKVRSVINNKTTVVPIRCFSTVSGVIQSYQSIISLIYDLVITHQAEANVVESIEDTTDVRLEKTIGTQFRRCVWSNMDSFLYYKIAGELFNQGQYSSVLVTSSGPNGKSLLLPAIEHGIDTYCLPHSIRTQRVIEFSDVVFTEGQIANYSINSKQTKYVESGLPKHTFVYKRRDSVQLKDDTNILLIGTQPYTDSRRREFIGNVVPEVYDETDWNIAIKIHPGENVSFYEDLLSGLGLNPTKTDRIKISDSDLYSWIGRSQLLLTINSNVGIESIILGTPAASYNPWSPDIRDPLYAKHGPVPTLREPSELVSLLTDWDGEHERTHQEPVIDNLYLVRGNSIEKITDWIQTEMTAPTEAATQSHRGR